jgi:hypothetical protein
MRYVVPYGKPRKNAVGITSSPYKVMGRCPSGGETGIFNRYNRTTEPAGNANPGKWQVYQAGKETEGSRW